MEFAQGLDLLLTPSVLVFVFLGTAAGLFLGALPGLDITTGVALLLPVTYALSPAQALIFFASMYAGGVFAGSITGILFRIPGSSEAVMTAMEGHHFTARGEAGIALGVSVYASAIGGLIASVALFSVTPFLAAIALGFGPAEYFAVGVLGLSCMSAVASRNQLKGMAAVLIGLLLATVGMDQITGVPRFDFGVRALLGGIPFVPAMIGLFAASEVYRRIARRDHALVRAVDRRASVRIQLVRVRDLIKLRWTILRSALLGLFIGILPGAGATTAAIVGYGTEVRLSARPEEFGAGKLEGIAAPEAANNAAAVGAMIPLLALGIPGSATTAVLIGAFLIHNLQPGPFFFTDHGQIAYALFGGIALTNVVMLLFGLLFIRLFARLADIPYPLLATSILTLSVVGTLAFGGVEVVVVMLFFAALGFTLEANHYPLAGIVLGLVLGPIVETSLRRALLMTGFDFWAVISRPVTAGLLLVALGFLLAPASRWLWWRFGSQAGSPSST
jgi:putative tricarboxylic transport membrane protein